MISGQELTPKSFAGLIRKEDISNLDQWAIAPTLHFVPDILGQSKWQAILEATQKDNNERKLSIFWDGKNISTSDVLEGNQVRFGTQKETEKNNLFTFSYSIRRALSSLFNFKQEIVSIHSHPKPTELNHLPTTTVSDTDINTFLGSSLKAMVMIDVGGVHLLARTPYSSYFSDPETDKPQRIAQEAFDASLKKNKLVSEVRKETAEGLKTLGIRYYYSPNLIPNSNGFMELKDVLR